ncbi:LysR family transcriptional regulator [Ilyobacter polytropus]|uniref:Transcriptional regulator, LysR family n=1 Tax=Ilyobacter polytropus (strain ATCC 51220 / DSM 2926 / LMG 16218 / CuHBu1) TaxID=572544 RepID=E3HC29_ILYPC|nr:LysR family transcriptional regulator [Ilyobacter polytropus]ADO83872.1 transcriptional regulator, LysR family [Ilyobacter polytropus DSM 2926]
MMDRDWELISVLYQEKNITKASAKLYISQPAVTKRLQMIESKLGVQIVERGRKGVHFTPEGEYLVKCAEEMRARMREIMSNLSSMTKEVKGVIKIGASNNFARKTLPKILSEYQERYPDVKFEISTGWSSEIFKLLCNKEIEVAFIRGEYKWSQGEKLLFQEKLFAINSEKIKIEDLPKFKKIEYNCDIKLKSILDNWWRENFSDHSLKGLMVDRSDTCKEMVMQGLGFALVPSTILKENDKLFKLELLDKNGEFLKRNTKMLYYENFKETNLGKTFLEIVDAIDFKN